MIHAKAYVCDVSDQSQVDATMALVEHDTGAPSVLIHNAVGGASETFTDIDPAVLNRNFRSTQWACFTSHDARRAGQVTASQGAIIVTGNTSAQRGRRILQALPRRKRPDASSPRRWLGSGTKGCTCCLHCH